MRLVEDVRVLLPTHRPQPCFELTAWTNNNGGFDAAHSPIRLLHVGHGHCHCVSTCLNQLNASGLPVDVIELNMPSP